MKAGALGWAAAVVLSIILAANILQGRDAEGYDRAERERLQQESDARQYAHDTLKARYAELAVGWQKGNDSLRRVIARVRGMTYRAPGDTLVLTYTQVRYVTDTLLPACEVCAARLDSAVLAARAEREAATLLLKSKDTQIDWWVTHDKPHHSLRTKLRERIGLTISYGVTSAGGQVYVGPQVGLSLRLVP